MTDPRHDPQPLARLRAMDLAVDIGFAVLLVVCGIRYFAYHSSAGIGTVVLALAASTGIAYACAVTGPRRPRIPHPTGMLGTRLGVGLLVAIACWLPLVVLAPSFGWCAFALFFAVRRVLSGRAALVVSGLIVVAVSCGLYLMSSGQDLGLVLGPFFGGLVLSYAQSALDRALSEQQRLIDELVEAREQLARSEREAGALAERGRVASELHDTVVQRTAGALLLLESEGGGRDAARIEQVREALREALVETRRLMHGLASPRADAERLSALLGAQAAEAGAAYELVGEERDVAEPVAHALMRVTREALINARKHAGSAAVHVTLTYFSDAVGVDIADDGAGFEHDGTTEGFGLRAMEWRVRSRGGEFTIDSAPGRGTVVGAVLPSPETPQPVPVPEVPHP
ncbi:ATP-binding protein [Leucobacter sp. gxy201]|uniref:sensor histidine kinase n=1 Tax=Leucobacter sp. gxy201 TaxID=2957200 RepID=UPI003DA0DC7F